jgi:hypothetical protein
MNPKHSIVDIYYVYIHAEINCKPSGRKRKRKENGSNEQFKGDLQL